jgi:hypothetical protein
LPNTYLQHQNTNNSSPKNANNNHKPVLPNTDLQQQNTNDSSSKNANNNLKSVLQNTDLQQQDTNNSSQKNENNNHKLVLSNTYFQQQNTNNSYPNNANIIENNPKPILPNSYVVRPKAKKCSKVLFMNSRHNSWIRHNLQNRVETKTKAKPTMHVNGGYNDSLSNNKIEHVNEFLSFSDAERELFTNLLFDINMGDHDVYLSEFLNSDFSHILNSYFNELLPPCSEQTPMLSDEFIKDWTM